MARYISLPKVPLVWTVTVLFVCVEGFCWWIYNYKWLDRESIAFIATGTAGAFGLYAFLRGVQETRMQATVRLIERWNDPRFRALIDATRPFVEKDKNSADYARPTFSFASSTATDATLRGNIQAILNFFEEVAIYVEAGTVEEEELKEFFGAVMPRGYEGFEGFILGERNNAGGDRDYYRKIQGLVERWTGVRRRDV